MIWVYSYLAVALAVFLGMAGYSIYDDHKNRDLKLLQAYARGYKTVTSYLKVAVASLFWPLTTCLVIVACAALTLADRD